MGSEPSASDLFKRAANGVASRSAPSFRSLGHIPSGPQALLVQEIAYYQN